MGHQCIGQVFGGAVIRAPCGVMHGKPSPVHHHNVGVLQVAPLIAAAPCFSAATLSHAVASHTFSTRHIFCCCLCKVARRMLCNRARFKMNVMETMTAWRQSYIRLWSMMIGDCCKEFGIE